MEMPWEVMKGNESWGFTAGARCSWVLSQEKMMTDQERMENNKRLRSTMILRILILL